jgi:hypothetical protein
MCPRHVRLHWGLDCARVNPLELVPTLMIDDLDKSCAKAEPNFDKWNVKTSVVWLNFQGGGKFAFYSVQRFGLECPRLSRDLSPNINQHKLAHKSVKCDKMVLMFLRILVSASSIMRVGTSSTWVLRVLRKSCTTLVTWKRALSCYRMNSGPIFSANGMYHMWF